MLQSKLIESWFSKDQDCYLEQDLNEWLKENKDKKIVNLHYQQSASQGDNTRSVLILYSE